MGRLFPRFVPSIWTTNICRFSPFPRVATDLVSGTVFNNALVGSAIARETLLLLTAATSGGCGDGDGGIVRACVCTGKCNPSRGQGREEEIRGYMPLGQGTRRLRGTSSVK